MNAAPTEEKKVKGGIKEEAVITEATQPAPIAEIFSTSNGSNIEEKEALHPHKSEPLATTPTATIPSTSTSAPICNESVATETITTATKAANVKKPNKNEANVDLIIEAPVAKPGSPLIDGIFVAPDKDSLSIAIGGAEINFDIVAKNTTTNNASETLNGEKLPVALKGAIPTFLLLASDSARRSFFEIENNGNIPKIQYLQAITLWAQQQTPEVVFQTAFNQYLENLKTTKLADQQNLTEKAKTLSQAAQRANTQIQDIQNNDNLTKTQEQTKINDVFNNLPKKVQKELTELTGGGNAMTPTITRK